MILKQRKRGKNVATKNDVTGDSLISKPSNVKFAEGMKLIKPSCLKDCKYLVDTLTKCRVCSWHPKAEK